MSWISNSLGTEAKLRERVKELSCLYEVVRLAEQLDESFDEVLQGIAELLPAAWQYPEITAGQVELDGRYYRTASFTDTPFKQSADIIVGGRQRGHINVVYLEERPMLYEGPFLEEERHLINALAREVSGIVERHQAREEKARLENQIRHADRLATIGQLAAGVAHELNEPLGNILGFAQLAEKNQDLPELIASDLKKIVDSCLYARKIVSKLKLFARQMPAQRAYTNINDVVKEGMFFIEARSAKQGVAIVKELDHKLPPITADPGQLHQVLTNLTVNALQAMPNGGVLTVRTRTINDKIGLAIEDTGIGMDEEVKSKIFLPFFTTKDVDQGTGLGLSVVQGIVTAHGGVIEVKSHAHKGTTFEVFLPMDGSGKEAQKQ